MLNCFIEERFPDADVIEFVDNGYSGTNFNRPGIKALLSLSQKGEVDGIVVKDFSRFGRNCIETGFYIEKFFPLTGVRFIALGDGYDSVDNAEGICDLGTMFKFLTNELYSRDLSEKIRSAKAATMRRGECARNDCPYGYTLTATRTLELDPGAADVVWRIFALASAGKSTGQIRAALQESKIPTPAGAIKTQRKKLAASQRRRDELDKLIQRIYEDNVAGRITDKRFEVLSAEYEQEQSGLEQAISELQAEVDSFDDSAARAENFLELTRRYKDFSELTAPMLHEFVEKIVIHERAEKRVQFTTQKVDIYLNFIGPFVPPVAEPAEELDPADAAEQAIREKHRLYHREYQRKRRANGGKPLTPEDTRTPEQIAADAAARKEKWKAYDREYQREYQRKLARQRREAKEAAAGVVV